MAIQGIDFANLSLKDALDLAILVEDEAQERYEDFAAQMEQHRTPEAAKFFRYMVENEAKHGRELQTRGAGLRRRPRLHEPPQGHGSSHGLRSEGPRLLRGGPAGP